MRKRLLRNSPLYFLFFANSVYACRNRLFGWLFWTAAVLTAVSFAWDTLEVMSNAR